MLVLTRRAGESLCFGDNDTVTQIVKVLRVDRSRVTVRVEDKKSITTKSLGIGEPIPVTNETAISVRMITGRQAKLVIHAPDSVLVLREEIERRNIAV